MSCILNTPMVYYPPQIHHGSYIIYYLRQVNHGSYDLLPHNKCIMIIELYNQLQINLRWTAYCKYINDVLSTKNTSRIIRFITHCKCINDLIYTIQIHHENKIYSCHYSIKFHSLIRLRLNNIIHITGMAIESMLL